MAYRKILHEGDETLRKISKPVVDFDSLHEVLVISDWNYKSYEFDIPQNSDNATDGEIYDTQSGVDNINNQNITEENNSIAETYSVG